MTNEIINALISLIVAILGVFLPKFFTHKYSIKTHRNTILEEQYNSIFIPIIKVFSFSKKEEQFNKIEIIVKDNFNLLPKELLESFKDCVKNKRINSDFKQQIDFGYNMLNSRIGYSITALDKNKIKTTNKIIDMGDKMIKHMKKTFIAALIIVIITGLIAFLNLFNVIQIPDYLPRLFYISAFMVELSPLIIYLLRISFLEFKQPNNK